jgi:DNA-binding MarR family transcriptional regulator
VRQLGVIADEERVRALTTRYPDQNFEAIDVTIALGRAASTVERLLARRLKGYEMTPVALQVLISVLLADGGPIDLTTLGAQIRVTKANVSLVLQGLERQDLVERVTEPTDGRRIRVRLTPRGRDVLDEVVPLAQGTMEEALEPLSVRDRRELRRLLRRIDMVP